MKVTGLAIVPPPAAAEPQAEDIPLDVLFEDNHLLVVNKPPGIATQGAEPGSPSLLNSAKDFLKTKYNKPGNAYIGVVSRPVFVFSREQW